MADSSTERCSEQLELIKRLVDEPSTEGDALVRSALTELAASTATPLTNDMVLCFLYGVHYLFLRNDVTAALVCAAKASELARRLGNDELLSRALRYEGATRIETGDLLNGVNCSLEALSVATRNADRIGHAGAWNNLGCVLAGAGQIADAITCFQKSAQVAEGLGDRTEWTPYSNIAECSARTQSHLHLGLSAAKKAVALNCEPCDATERDSLASSEASFARLLVYLGEFATAREHAAAARRFADYPVSERAETHVLLAEGLLDVASGSYESGKLILTRAIGLARACGLTIHIEALAACVHAFDLSGQPDTALEYLQEWLELNRQAKKQEIAIFHRMLESGIEISGDPEAAAHITKGFVDLQLKIEVRLQQLSNTCVNAALSSGHDANRIFRVAKLATLLAATLGWDEDRVRQCSLAAKLADIGMIAMPDLLLRKSERLTDAERKLIDGHASVGAELLAAANLKQLAGCIPVARYHHEAWDGSGPAGISGEAIPIEARIVTICDRFDSMTHSRPWRPAMEPKAALGEIARCSGSKFDPALCSHFIELMLCYVTSGENMDSMLGVEASQDAYVSSRSRISSMVGQK